MILRGGTVVDGSGEPGYDADVEVRHGRIGRILPPGRPSAEETLDVAGLVIAPGFIDMHAHSDLAVLADPEHLAKVGQGITLEVVGQDGIGYSPATDDVMAATRAQIAGWNGDPPLDYGWRTVAEYLARIDEGAALNVAVLVPHGTVRQTVMGMDPRAATESELARMRAILAQGLRDGAMGMSTGLSYPPGMFATDVELADALTVVREIGGYYCPHHRNYGSRVVESYRECLTLAERASVPLHLAHCHINFAINRGRAPEVLGAIDDAIARGVDVSLDAYPYLASATYLASFLPHWAQTGGPQQTIRLLSAPETSEAIRREVEESGSDGNHGVAVDWSEVTISSSDSPHVGLPVSQIAALSGHSAWDVVVDLLVSDRLATGVLLAVGNEENMIAVMRHHTHTVGTDGILVGAKPHPRGWGSFPEFIGGYARDRNLMSVEEAVSHATSRPAKRLGLTDRGAVVEGNWADLVVFDPATIGSPASYDEPTLPPTGIFLVMVNGEIVMHGGVRTDALPGRAVRRN